MSEPQRTQRSQRRRGNASSTGRGRRDDQASRAPRPNPRRRANRAAGPAPPEVLAYQGNEPYSAHRIEVRSGLCPTNAPLIVHCIGADATLGAGFAASLDPAHRAGLQNLIVTGGPLTVGRAYVTHHLETTVVHLVTKPESRRPPTDSHGAIRAAAHAREHVRGRAVVCPALGTGLDRQHLRICLQMCILLDSPVTIYQTHLSQGWERFFDDGSVRTGEIFPYLGLPPTHTSPIERVPLAIAADEQCMICLEAIHSVGDPIPHFSTLCAEDARHHFHRRCMNELIHNSANDPPQCPVCRSPLRLHDIASISGCFPPPAPPTDNIGLDLDFWEGASEIRRPRQSRMRPRRQESPPRYLRYDDYPYNPAVIMAPYTSALALLLTELRIPFQ